MKKKKIIIIIAIAAAVILTVGICVAVAAFAGGDPNKENESGSLSEGTLEGTEHLSPAESVDFPDSTDESNTEILTETEEMTESVSEIVTETLTESETDTEVVSESETEAETEPPVSLKYYSYGNGTCAVSGIGNYKDVYVIIPEKSPSGEIVTAIDDKAFYDNSSIKAVSIPSTVMSIGDGAFEGCSSLVYVSVSENNKTFTDMSGVLYSKDKTKLILFPSSNPATELFISVNVTEICDRAFSSSPNLKQINYGGTLRDWSQMKIGDHNYGIYSAAMTFAVTQ